MRFNFTDDVISSLFDKMDKGVYLIDENRIVTYWNRSAERISGFSAEEVVGKSCSENILNHIDGTGLELCGENCPLVKVMDTGIEESALVFLHHKDGFRVPIRVQAIPVTDRDGCSRGVLEIFSDTSEVRLTRRKADRLNRELYTDPLTDVGNRRFYDKELGRLFFDLRKRRRPFAVVLCDIDDFKWVNDTFGHDVGDRILAMTAGTVSETLRDGDLVCRWGGEEFIMLLPDVRTGEELVALAERIRILIGESFLTVGGSNVSVTASFGATLAKPGDGDDSLFNRVDKLLSRSKGEGKNRVSFG